MTIQKRATGTPQNVPDAGVYVVGLPSSLLGLPLQSTLHQITSELRAHLDVARTTRCPILVLTPRLLPKPGTVDPGVEALARLRDLSLLQLGNEREMEMVELINVVNGIGDAAGCLRVVRRLSDRKTSNVALEVRYIQHSTQAFDTI